MLGIKQIASYVPTKQRNNFETAKAWGLSDDFVENKIGVKSLALMSQNETTTSMALEAFKALQNKLKDELSKIDALVVVTQNPDTNIPHVSGTLHGLLKLSQRCITFDISLGCSGYVYGLNILESFLANNGLKSGVLITADPYSKIVDINDKNTSMLFGDAATATLLSTESHLKMRGFVGGSIGDLDEALLCKDGTLKMDGRGVFNFAVKTVPKAVDETLELCGLNRSDIDGYIFHQGSGYILDTLMKRLQINDGKVLRGLRDVGNTVSSSIPLILEKHIESTEKKRFLLCGFGVGLSYASCVYERMILNDT